jgi:hypothetical protein
MKDDKLSELASIVRQLNSVVAEIYIELQLLTKRVEELENGK